MPQNLKNSVFIPPIAFEPGNFSVLGLPRKLPLLKQSLLFWDHVAMPEVSEINIRTDDTPFLEELASDGIIELGHMKIHQSHGVNSAQLHQTGDYIAAYLAERQIREGQSWAMYPMSKGSALNSTRELFSAEKYSNQTVIQLALAETLPQIPHSVTLEQVVAFRNSRTDERTNLQFAINQIAAKYANLADSEEPIIKAQLELQEALKAYRVTAKERIPEIAFAGLNISALATAAFLGSLTGTSGANTIATVVAQYAAVKFLGKLQTRLPTVRRDGPFLYAIEASRPETWKLKF